MADWGSWSSWAAVLLAAAAGWLALSAKRREDARDQRQRERDRQEQAQLVAGWARDLEAGQFTHRRIGWTAVVSNTSDLPIFGVVISVGLLYDEELLMLVQNAELGLIPPRAEGTHSGKQSGPDYVPSKDLRVCVDFIDCAGQRWRRGFDGHLSLV